MLPEQSYGMEEQSLERPELEAELDNLAVSSSEFDFSNTNVDGFDETRRLRREEAEEIQRYEQRRKEYKNRYARGGLRPPRFRPQ